MQKKILTEVAIIRPILIVLLVFYHAFAPYSGGWAPIEGFPEIPAYWWMDKLSYFFMLEMFVFLSGYVFGYQVRTKGEVKLVFKSLFLSKFKRLMIPCMIFSVFYILLFRDMAQMGPYDLLNGIISGTGHMWFLPMLFVCFMAIWLIEKMHISPKIVLPVLFLAAMLPIKVLPLHAGHSVYYMFWFYLGYVIQRKDIQLRQYYTPQKVAFLAAVFVVLFPIVTLFDNDSIASIGGGSLELLLKLLRSGLSIVAKTIGIFMLLCLIGMKERNRQSEMPNWIIKIGGLCMGVYLFQQFVLKVLYDFTILPEYLGPFVLPWAGFVIALTGSLILTYLLQKIKLGRFILG